MPACVIESDAPLTTSAAYLDSPTVRRISAGSLLKGKARNEHLAALGVTRDGRSVTAPLSFWRHLVPSGIKRAQRDAILAAHKGNAILGTEDAPWNPKDGCPALAALGIGTGAQYGAQRRNGERSADGIALRSGTAPCPYCLGAAILADIAAERRSVSEEYVAALRATT